MKKWTKVAGGFQMVDEDTGLELRLDEHEDHWDFNGHHYQNEVDAKAAGEAYADRAALRHGLGPNKKATK